MTTLADCLLEHVLSFTLDETTLPDTVGVLDPFNGPQRDEVLRIVKLFHRKYYSDNSKRLLMLGISPGRLGAGSTGLSFTDTKRCEAGLGIPVNGMRTHEPSSDFFYRMIRAYGGPGSFYDKTYVHAICPLGFVKDGPLGRPINLNYYDDKDLQRALTPFITNWLRTLVACGMRTDVVFCIGTGKNAAYFKELNDELDLFDRIIPLEHPRYVMQYKAKQLGQYIAKYMDALHDVG